MHRGCAGKKRYPNYARAQMAMTHIGHPLTVYLCDRCRHWHLGGWHNYLLNTPEMRNLYKRLQGVTR